MLLLRCLHRAGNAARVDTHTRHSMVATFHRRPRGQELPRGSQIRDSSKKCSDAAEKQRIFGGWRVEMTNIVAISHHRAAIIPLEDAH